MELIIKIKACSYYQYLSINRFRKYITNRGRDYKNIIEYELTEYMTKNNLTIIDKNCKVELSLYLDNRRKNDVDNFVKPILDFMSDIVYTDDRLITKLYVEKFYDKENPRIIIKCNEII